MKIIVIMNETHSLLSEQKDILEAKYPQGYETLLVPASGWNKEEMDGVINSIQENTTVVFLSPIPYMIMGLVGREMVFDNCFSSNIIVKIFNNDNREITIILP